MVPLATSGRRPLFIGLLLATSVGCVHYRPKPMNPVQTLASFESRTTNDPGLRSFLAANNVHLSDPPKWDLRALTLVAFYFHPDLDEARAAAEISRGAVLTAGQRPNPQVFPALTVDTTTPPPWIPSFGLQIPIETAGKRRLRVDEARQLQRSAQLRIVGVAWQIRSRLRRALVEFVAARRTEEILQRQTSLADEVAEISRRQLDAGAVTPFEAAQARLVASNLRLASQQAALQRAVAGISLADALGLPSKAFDDLAPYVAAGEFEEAQVPADSARRLALVSRVDVLAALSDYEAAQAALRLEIARQYPDIQLGPGYQLDQKDNKWTVIGLGVTLPVFNRNKGPIAEAEALREQRAARLLSVQSAALKQVSQAAAEWQAARQKLATAQELLATAQEQQMRAQTRYELGDVPRQELLTAQLETVTVEAALADAQRQADLAAGALEDAMQSPLGFENLVLVNPRR
jgi:outer membrane protein TolC